MYEFICHKLYLVTQQKVRLPETEEVVDLATETVLLSGILAKLPRKVLSDDKK